MSPTPASISIHLRSQDCRVQGANRTFVRSLRIGRGTHCEVQVDAEMVSRVHAKLFFEEGHWWLSDLDSTNGTYRDGESIDHISLLGTTSVQLGRDGPVLHLEVSDDWGGGATEQQSTSVKAEERDQRKTEMKSETSASRSENSSLSASEDPSVTQYVQRYFEKEQAEAGEHTRMIQQAYQKVHSRQRRKYLGILAGVLGLCILLGGYALVQHLRNNRLRTRVQEVWAGMKEQEVLMAQLKRSVEASNDASLQNRLAALEQQRQQQEARYRGYVSELGLHRDLTAKEREIYRVARLFGESEFSIPAGFVRKVKRKIQKYWKGSAREGLVRAIQRAERKGYTSHIVQTMQRHALPPEFFYLALQESRFDRNAVGPRTRWGIAKGMWQFIPKTARKYGLQLGPRVNQRVPDPGDERHDFQKSTRAAADYLQDIYSTRAQASGLLVVASYNWGEHRIVEKMKQLPGPQHIPKSVMKGIPEDPTSRSYWRFLTTYEERMPAETRDYVLKVFSAAVIGQAPGLFGFSFENPLQEHLEAPSDPQTVSTDSTSKTDRGPSSNSRAR